MIYKVKADAIVWRTIWGIGKRDLLHAGRLIESTYSKNNYTWIESPTRGWVALALLEPVYTLPPQEFPQGGDIRMTIRGDTKQYGYKPEGINYGSFDIIWLMPEAKIAKPGRIQLRPEHPAYILRLNGGRIGALKWLVAQEADTKVLSLSSDGRYSIPVPCGSGNNFVRVLEYKNDCARIETVNINKPLPEALPVHLIHTWYGFTRGGEYYMIDGAFGGIKYPLFFNADSAWVQVKGLK